MSHKILISIILILLSTLPAVPQEKTEREAYRNARTAFLAAETAVKKINVLKSFAAEWPDHPVVVDFALSQAVNIYRSPLDDVAGAIEFVSSARNKTGVRSIRLGASRLLAGLYGEAGRPTELKRLVLEETKLGGLDYDFHDAVINAAIEVGSWDLALEQCEAALKLSSPEAVLAEIPYSSKFPPERLTAISKWRKGDVLARKGWALENAGRADESGPAFAEAKKNTIFDYLGVSQNNYALYRARTQLRHGNVDGAIETIAPNALYRGGEEFISVLKEAFAEKTGSEEGFDRFTLDLREKLGRVVEDFSLKDYSGKERRFSDLKGRATILVFWFPT